MDKLITISVFMIFLVIYQAVANKMGVPKKKAARIEIGLWIVFATVCLIFSNSEFSLLNWN